MIIRESIYQERRAVADNNCDLAIIVGDSRANGANYYSNLTTPQPQLLGQKLKTYIFYKPDLSPTNDNGTVEIFDAESNQGPGYARPTPPVYPFGPTWSFANKVNNNVFRQVCIMKLAIGGSSLIEYGTTVNDWSMDVPTVGAPSTNELSERYWYYFYTYGLRKLANASWARQHRLRPKCMFVAIGSNDSLTTRWNATTFRAQVLSFVTFFKKVFRAPNLPIYWEGPRADLYLAPSGLYTQANVDACRLILTNIADSGHADYIPNFFFVDYASLALLADGVHNTADADFTKGETMADTFLTYI